ncbi:LysR family transcriptional regulator [Amylibacter sp.]|nr:LysR family transcriptional regulator [Amylibacter sp.]
MDWDKLRIFHSVADVGSLTHAGDVLHLSQSAVSRQIRALEEKLNVTLFHRHARGLILTEQGELLYEATSHMSKRLETAEARIRDSKDEVFGELRVTTTTGFGTLWLAPRINRLYEQYPDLNIDLILEERVLDLPMREADVAIRMKEPSQADLVRRRLMNVKMRLYATQKYLDIHGTPTSIDELDVHRLVTQGLEARQVNESIAWFKPILEQNHGSNLTLNNYFGVLQAVLHDTGIGVLPDYVSDEVPELVRVLPEDQSKEIPVFLAFPEELRHSKRVQAFRDFVLEEIKTHRLHKFENV